MTKEEVENIKKHVKFIIFLVIFSVCGLVIFPFFAIFVILAGLLFILFYPVIVAWYVGTREKETETIIYICGFFGGLITWIIAVIVILAITIPVMLIYLIYIFSSLLGGLFLVLASLVLSLVHREPDDELISRVIIGMFGPSFSPIDHKRVHKWFGVNKS